MAEYIIIEGPDGAGKSTLVEKLLEQYPRAVFAHFSYPKTPEEATAQFQFDLYTDFIRRTAAEKVVIVDRCWYSNIVYAQVMRNQEEVSMAQSEILELLFKAAGGAHVIYLTARPDVLWKRCRERGEFYIKDKATLIRIRDKYEEVMKQLRYLPVVRMDTGVNW